MRSFFRVELACLILAFLGATGCRKPPAEGWQGYIEGEFVHVAAPLGGRLEKLQVSRGTQVAAGAPLYQLDPAAETAAHEEAKARLAAARARWQDLQTGLRPTELEALEARLAQARTAAEISAREFVRQEELFTRQTISASAHDQARLIRDRDVRLVEDLTAQLATARLGARPDAVAAAKSEVAAATAVVERAAWAVREKTPIAPTDAFVHDTLFRVGDYVPAGAPVVSLLPPANRKVRFFVPEPELLRVQPGQRLAIRLSGAGTALPARVAYVSPAPEYTPPVLYNRANRAKLVFMVEAAFDPVPPNPPPPGQPVDVLPSPSP